MIVFRSHLWPLGGSGGLPQLPMNQYHIQSVHPCDFHFNKVELVFALDDSMEAEQGSEAQARL